MGTHPIFESDFDCLTDAGALEPVQKIGGRISCPDEAKISGMEESKSTGAKYKTERSCGWGFVNGFQIV